MNFLKKLLSIICPVQNMTTPEFSYSNKIKLNVCHISRCYEKHHMQIFFSTELINQPQNLINLWGISGALKIRGKYSHIRTNTNQGVTIFVFFLPKFPERFEYHTSKNSETFFGFSIITLVQFLVDCGLIIEFEFTPLCK